jgi:hypothetical protein
MNLYFIMWPVEVSIALGASMLNAWLAVTVPRTSSAIERTRVERDQLISEKDGFKKFAKRVSALDPDEHTARSEYTSHLPATAASGATVVDPIEHTNSSVGGAEPVSISKVRDAYRETVMAVPHYQKEYGESIDTNLAAELGPELAQTLIKGNVLTAELQAAVTTQAQQARKQRSNLLSFVEIEHESLTEMRRRLRDLCETAITIEDNLYPQPVRKLVQSWTRLETIETDCKTLLRERQTNLQTEYSMKTMSTWSFQEYLYHPFQWQHPVLNDGVEMLSRIRRSKRETIKAIYNW